MRSLLVRSRAFDAAMHECLTVLAVIGVGADEHPAALVVGNDFIEVRIFRPAQRAWRVEAVAREWMIFKIERHHRRIRRNRIDPLLAGGAEQMESRTIG